MVSRLPAVSTKIRLTTVLSAGTLKHRLIHSALTARKVATFLKSASTVACFGNFLTGKIGRASCRERVCQYVSISVVAVSLKKKKEKRNRQKHGNKVTIRT